jgi:hypothetical protein
LPIPPAPQGQAGLQDSSKLDDFDAFVSHSKLSLLPLAPVPRSQAEASASAGDGSGCGGGPSSSDVAGGGGPSGSGAGGSQAARGGAGKLLLLDDLPYVGDAERRLRLTESLKTLALTARCPVVLVTTETTGGGGGGRGGFGGGGSEGGGLGAMGGFSKGLHKDVVALLDGLGAATISFNKVAPTALTKALAGLAAAEGVVLTHAAAAAIAKAADGDLRNAIQNLQVFAGAAPRAPPGGACAALAKASRGRKRAAGGGAKGRASEGEAGGAAGGEHRIAAQLGRDARLCVYHALGKLLNNKRDPEGGGGGGAQEQGQQQAARPQKRGRRSEGADAEAAARGFRVGAEPVELPAGAPPLALKPE